MKKANRWTHGIKDFVLPPLPRDLQRRHGCFLQRMTFDPQMGEEICAIYLEEPEYAFRYGKIHPFNMFARSGLVRTPYGLVAFIVWQIAVGSADEIAVEQYLNPQNIEVIRLVSSAASQTHFKLIVVDNQSSEVTAFIDFENVFRFDLLASGMALSIGHEPEGDFATSMRHAMENFTITELLDLPISGSSD